MFLVYNSDILNESDFRLSVHDRAFNYGDGLFETIRYESGQVWFWPDHVARLRAGMSALALTAPDPFTDSTLMSFILQLIDLNQLTNQPARVRIQIWRQAGGLYTPASNNSHMLVTAQPGSAFSITEKRQTDWFDAFRLTPSPVSAFKTINALPYVLAGLYKSQQKLDEVILLDTAGHLAECLASSLFWYANNTLYTPSLQTGCIDGILRRQLLRIAPTLGIPVRVDLFRPEALQHAEAVFCTNVMGVQWLTQVSTYPLPPSPKGKERLGTLLNQLHL